MFILLAEHDHHTPKGDNNHYPSQQCLCATN
jgi:hypothetical protein